MDIDRQLRAVIAFLDSHFTGFETFMLEFLATDDEGDGDGDTPRITVSDLRDMTEGRLPLLLCDVRRAPEHDTDGRAGFVLEWEMIGGSRPIKVVSLAQREKLRDYGRLAVEAHRADETGGDTKVADP